MDDFMDEYDEKDRLRGDKKIPFLEFARRILHYLRPELPRFILAAVLLLINVGLDVVLPLITARMTDVLTSVSPDLSFLIRMAVVYFAVSLLNNVFLYAESMLLQKAGQQIIYDLRMDVFEHIEEMSRNQFAEMPVGSLVTRVTSYTQTMSDLFTNVIVSVIKNFLTVFGVYVIMFILNVKLALILLVPVTVIFITSMIFSRYVGGAFRRERKKLSELNTFLNENLSGMKIIQLFGREE
ncbi:MAG: ABC transporter ATP-binding protein, partial [Clostridia bacterium]|nr:ABC transporter ATP-binding protein [Clostridia bacterium]